MTEHPFQAVLVAGEQPVECPLADPVKWPFRCILRFRFQKPGTHHRRQRQRNDAGHQNRQTQCHRKFVKQPANQPAHEQQWDKDCDQRDADRNHRESDLLCAFERGFHHVLAVFDVPVNIFDDDNGVVHDESNRNRDRHQRQIINAVAEHVHARARTGQRQRHGHACDKRRPEAAQK